MEVKKNPKANLENYRGIFFLVGMILSLIIIFFTISQSKADVGIENINKINEVTLEEELPQITRPEPIEPPPPPKKQANISNFEIVDNKKDITDIFDFISEPDDDVVFDPTIGDDTEDDIFGNDDNDILVFTPHPPKPYGGISALRQYVAENIIYPELAIENEIEGTVVVRFVVTKTGKIGKIEILNGPNVDDLLEEEAIRVVKTLPDFEPGYDENGRPVNVWFSMPVVFQLQ